LFTDPVIDPRRSRRIPRLLLESVPFPQCYSTSSYHGWMLATAFIYGAYEPAGTLSVEFSGGITAFSTGLFN
jgi:hypothetical protein